MKKIKAITARKGSKKGSRQINTTTRKNALLNNLMHDDHGSVIIGKRDEPPGF